MIITIGIAVIGTLILSSVPYVVKQKSEVIVEKWGAGYSETVKKPGLHFKMPWPFRTIGKRVNMAIHEKKEELQTKTKDDVFVSVPIKAHLQVVDSSKYTYETTNPEDQVMTRVAATVKQLTSQMDFAELFQARETISEKVRQNVGPEIEAIYGMRLVDVIVDEPKASQKVQDSYNSVLSSKRDLEAAINRAEAARQAMIKEAEGRKEALKLDGEGIAAQRSAIFANYAEQFNALAAKGLTNEQAHEVIMAAMANDTVRDAAKHQNLIITTVGTKDEISSVMAATRAAAKPKDGGDVQPG